MRPDTVLQRPGAGQLMRQRGGCEVRVVYAGMRYARVVNADDGLNSRLIRLGDLLPTEPTAPPAPKRFASDLDREFLSDLS